MCDVPHGKVAMSRCLHDQIMWIEPALALPARQHRLVASMLPKPA
jgi:hypothetical protein